MGSISSVVEGLMYVMEFREIMCRAGMVCMWRSMLVWLWCSTCRLVERIENSMSRRA